MATVTFEEARDCVLTKVSSERTLLDTEQVSTSEGLGRVLAEAIYADRDSPPVSRSVRDGFAVRASDLPGELFIVGEVRAGETFAESLDPGQAIEIMTGAPLPPGADSVIMVEHATVNGEKVRYERAVRVGENVNPKGSEARSHDLLLDVGARLGPAQIALIAMAGHRRVWVYRQLEVAILSTGDELVEVEEQPLEYQIRNTNSPSLAAQVAKAGAKPQVLPIARDLYAATRELIEHGLRFDLLLVSGGVSAGKYDIVERVLSELGAEFFFDRVLIQPGQPLVFGEARNKFFFGLPGNPASTMVTFEVFARSAIELLSGQTQTSLPLPWSRLKKDFHQKPGLTRFLPACLSSDGSEVTPISWSGSGDIPALARANAFLVTDPAREQWAAGDLIRVMLT